MITNYFEVNLDFGNVYLIIDNDNVKTMESDQMGSGLKKISTSLKDESNVFIHNWARRKTPQLIPLK